jgi:hypothetical protein
VAGVVDTEAVCDVGWVVDAVWGTADDASITWGAVEVGEVG